MPDGEEAFYGKNASELMENVAIYDDGGVKGTLKYVTGYTQFNESDPEEQEGHFFPFVLGKTGTNMTFKKNGSPGKTDIPWEANNVFRVEKGDTFQVLVDGEEVVTFNFQEATFEEVEGA